MAPETGNVISAPNLDWHGFPLRARIEQALDLPVEVMNDVQAIAYGEWQNGAGSGVDDMACVFVGTGVGGGVISGGRFLTGSSGTAGEVGHIVIEHDGPSCTCGGRGCLESLTGGWAISRRARSAVADAGAVGDALIEAAGGEADRIDAETVAAASRAGDPLARALIEDTGRYLGAGLASIVNAFNPALIVLGGGVIEGMPVIAEVAESELRSRALDAALQELRVVRSSLGADAGAIGVTARLRNRLPARSASR